MRRIVKPGAEMPFLEHLEELRWRIIWSLVAIAIGLGTGFFVVLHYDLITLLERPVLPYLGGHSLVGTHPTDGLQLTIQAAMWIGAVLALPVVIYQAWLFLSPALYPRERSLLVAALIGGIALFIAGAVFAFEVVLPLSLPMLFSLFATSGLETMITAQSYFGFLFGMVLSFGIAFELPVVVLLLAAAGLVTPQFLGRYRRHATVLIIVASAFLTPGDFVWTTVALAVPLYLLFELSVLVARVIWRHKRAGDESIAILLAPFLLLRRRPGAVGQA
jgi:sec-independent protein translocase protein TatC